MRSLAVQRAFTRRVRALERDRSSVLDDDVEALHRARVASRRLREILPVLGLERGPGRGPAAAKIGSRLRRLTRALGRVRELDVVLGILDDLRRAHPDLSDALMAARVRVEEDRRSRRDEMIRHLDEIQANRLAEELSSLGEHVGHEPASSRAVLLRRRLERRADRLEAAIEAAGALYAFDRLHLVRIACKRLRYILELVHEIGRVPALRLVNRLKRFQDLLGRLHDLEVVAGDVRRQSVGGPGHVANGVDRVQRLLDRETRDLHAVYLARVAGLVDVIARCRTEIDRKLAESTPPRRRVAGSRHGG
jgi:CHAD domain-containing protein